ncbi:MAG: SAM-dependent methyltransferase [Proteobacteria bacterium]|nr:SAM-dependent methyltransferase [Pseudomonadota bacterium]
MDTLESVIKSHIRTHGPMTIETFMGMVLAHPRFGYYMTRDPLGAPGDFTTAPEISQLFGEMLGLCLADAWLRAGAPDFDLVEFGPGRGTLMADLLRATKNIPAFHDRMRLHLVEMSPVLREKQAAMLKVYKPNWHDSHETLPTDRPLLMVANEFFDALPIQQVVNGRERVIGLDARGELLFGLGAAMPVGSKHDDVYEHAPIRDAFAGALAERIKSQGGLMLAIDYGHDTPNSTGDTLQAVYKHTFCGVLENIGHADLTSHVDFYRLRQVAEKCGCTVFGSVTQKDFLESLGIRLRLKMLDTPALQSGVERLLAPDEMGLLFRVIAFASGFSPAGFGNPA